MLEGSKLEIFEDSGREPHDEEPEKFDHVALDFLNKTRQGLRYEAQLA